ncbi:MAG: HD domain-containing protein [Actinomycetes bacterium]
MLKNIEHLYRRWRAMGEGLGSVTSDDVAMTKELLSDAEFGLWRAMSSADQVHSVQVLRIFEKWEPDATRDEKSAALLHDVAKAISPMSRMARSVATICSFRRERWRWYRHHEEMGVEALQRVGSSKRTIDLVRRSAPDAVALRLYEADDSV